MGLALLGAIIFIVPEVESYVEYEVREALDEQLITAELIEYNLLENKLIIKGLVAKALFFDGAELSIGEIIAFSPSTDAFDLTSVGKPLIAKKIIANNIAWVNDFAGITFCRTY